MKVRSHFEVFGRKFVRVAIENFGQKALRWETYKAFFGFPVLKLLLVWFALVPILATLLEGIPSPISLSVGKEEFTLQLSLPFNWTILWLSSFFYALAFSSYLIWCPKFVRTYNSYSDYEAYKHDPRWLVWEAYELIKKKVGFEKFFKRLEDKGFVETRDDVNEFSAVDKPEVCAEYTRYVFSVKDLWFELKLPRPGACELKVQNDDKSMFWEIFGRYSESRKKTRWFIFWLLVISALLFLIVLIQHIAVGGMYVFEHFFGTN